MDVPGTDGLRNSGDLTTAIINFTGASNAAAAVPEPSGLVLAVGCLAESRMAGVGNRWDFVPGWADVRSSGRVGGTNRAKRW